MGECGRLFEAGCWAPHGTAEHTCWDLSHASCCASAHALPPALPDPSPQAKAAQKQAAALQSALSERMQACTFRPQTNHARRQEQLAQLLGEGEHADLAASLHDGY